MDMLLRFIMNSAYRIKQIQYTISLWVFATKLFFSAVRRSYTHGKIDQRIQKTVILWLNSANKL